MRPALKVEFGVLPHHAPFMTTLRPGVVTVLKSGGNQRFFVTGGLADVTPEGFTLLAEQAIPVEDIDPQSVAQDLEDLEKNMASLSDDVACKHAGTRLEELKAMQDATRLSS